MSTAMITSAPIDLAISMGMLLTTMPSMSSLPSITTGENTPGMAMLADMATGRLPSFRTTCSPVPTSVATARNRIGRSSKLSSLYDCGVRNFRMLSVRWPCTNPLRNTNPKSRMPISRSMRKLASSCLRRKERSSRGIPSFKTSGHSMLVRISSHCWGEYP